MTASRPLRSSPWFAGALLLAIAVWIIDLAALRAGVPHPLDDTWEDGIVARSLIEGHGFRTGMIYPPLWGFRDPATLTIPVLVHGPLLPLMLTLPIRAFGPPALERVAGLAALFALLTLFPLFRLAARRHGEPVAAAGCALFTLSPLAIEAVNHYASMIVGAFLVTWAVDLVARERPRPLAAGIVAGACYLTRPEMTLALPVLAWMAWSATRAAGDARHATAAALRLVLGFLVCAAWWWWEHWRQVGSPFFNLTSYLLASFSPAHPGDALVRDFAMTPRRYPGVLAESFPTLWRKWGPMFARAVKRALTTPATSLGWLVPFGVLAALRDRTRRAETAALVLLACIPLIAITLIASVKLYPVPFLPLYALAAALGARWILERLPGWAHRPRAWLLLLAMLALPAAAIEMKEQARQARELERWLVADRAALAAVHARAGEPPRLLFSDTPDFVAWTTGRPTIWLTVEEFEALFRADHGLPPGIRGRPAPEDTWFHEGDPRDPEGQRGFRLLE